MTKYSERLAAMSPEEQQAFRIAENEKMRLWRAANRDRDRANYAARVERDRDRIRGVRSAYYQANKEHYKELNQKRGWFVREYGITTEDRDAIFETQGSVCAICKSDTPMNGKWHIDHCHTTGLVRGVLCKRCNVGIGMFCDDPDLLSSAIEYLRQPPAPTVVIAVARTKPKKNSRKLQD